MGDHPLALPGNRAGGRLDVLVHDAGMSILGAADMTAAMGGGRSPQASAGIVVRLATLDPDGPTGTLQDDDGELRQ